MKERYMEQHGGQLHKNAEITMQTTLAKRDTQGASGRSGENEIK